MTTPKIALIVAMTPQRVIGRDNTLPWKISDDLKRFKALTTGHSIIMGRKTWDSLGRALPNRRNLIITRSADFTASGAEVFHSLEGALAACAHEARLFIIGGAQIYAQALAQADELFITEVHADIAGDAYFPEFAHDAFLEVARQTHPADDRNEFAFDFVDYIKHK